MLTNLNINPEWILIIAGIVGTVQGIKAVIEGKGKKRIYPILPLFFGFFAGLYLGFDTISQFIGKSLVFGGVAILTYDLFVKNVNLLFDFLKSKIK